MALFRNRPLAAASAALCLAVIMAYMLTKAVLIAVMVASLAAFLFLFLWLIVKKYHYRRFALLLLCVGCLLGTGRVLLERQRQATLASFSGQTVTAELTVKEVYSNTNLGGRLLAKVHLINGERAEGDLLLATEGHAPFYPGDRISGEFQCTALDEHIDYQGQASSYRADGASVALVPNTESLTLIKDGNGSAYAFLADMRGRLHHRIGRVTEGEAGDLVAAMTLGSRDGLNADTIRDFRRVGLSHLLAISGLHLSVIVGILERFLRLLRLNKQKRIILSLLFCVGYLFLTGCSFSMLRAVIMLAILQLSFFLKGDYDGFTALCFGGGMMLLIFPNAVYDLSFQLTMLATFGILAFGDLEGRLLRFFPKKRGAKGIALSLARTVVSSLLLTLCATMAILPVQWLIFGEVSLITPLANLLMIPLSAPLLVLGLLLLPLATVPVLSTALGWTVGIVAKAMLWIPKLLSPLPVMLSLQYDFVPFVILPFLLLTAVLLVVDLKKLKLLLPVPAVMAAVAFAICLGMTFGAGGNSVEAIYRTTGSNDGLVLVQNGKTLICDISNGSKTQWSADYLQAQKSAATEIEVLMLTHYHKKQITALSRFSKLQIIRSLWLPEPQTAQDTVILAELTAIALREGIGVTVYSYNTPLRVFDTGRMILSAPLYEDRSVEPALSLLLTYKDTSICLQSSAYSEYMRHGGEAPMPVDADILLLCGHGPKPKEEILPPMKDMPCEVVLPNEACILWWSAPWETKYILHTTVRRYILA